MTLSPPLLAPGEPVHVFIGTKAQYVKTAPVLVELKRRGIPYNLIDSGQHAGIADAYRECFELPPPNVRLRRSNEDITSVGEMARWFTAFGSRVLFTPGRLRRELFGGERGLCLVHGDTPTTLLSVLAAKRCGLRVAHLESGLRSYNLRHPFPEELIRIVSMRMADHLFVPSPGAMENLVKMGLAKKSVLLSGNTNLDAVRTMLARPVELPPEIPESDFALISIHRAETILRRKRLSVVVDLVLRVAKEHPTVFCVHPPTRRKLRSFGLESRLADVPGLVVRDLLPYQQFLHAMQRCRFLVADGGSIQEEARLLGTPCLVMRDRTEREDGIGENAVLAEFDERRIAAFLDDFEAHRRPTRLDGESPSREIVDLLCGPEARVVPRRVLEPAGAVG